MRRLRWPVLVVAGVLVAGSGTAYAVTSDRSTGNYRTVRASKGDVEQLLSTTGTVDAAHRADLGFGTSGTVADVLVALGDRVKAGQVIATLDRDALGAAVTKARASVARAVAQLASDEEAQADAVADSSADSSAASGSNQPKADQPSATPTSDDTAQPSAGGSDPAVEAALAKLRDQQAAVVDAQSKATAAIAAAKDALTAQQQACKDAYEASATSGSGKDAGGTSGDACSSALDEVQARQDDVSDAQDALASALSDLATTLAQAQAALEASSASSPSGSSTPSASDSSSPSGSQTPSSGGSDAPAADGSAPQSTTPSAATLAADQAEIERARADLVDARQQLAQAVLRSTRSGIVRSLTVHEGDEVAAGDAVAVVVGGRAVTVATSVSESKIGQVEVGQAVRVSMPGESGRAEGRVTAIGLVADRSSGTATYAVTVTVEDPAIALPTGSQALLDIVVANAKDVVTVPLSAVTRRGDQATVQTWDGTSLSTRTVTTGTVGDREVEVTQGLSAGDAVVLADIDQDITGAADSINDRSGFGRVPVRIGGPGGTGGPPGASFKTGP